MLGKGFCAGEGCTRQPEEGSEFDKGNASDGINDHHHRKRKGKGLKFRGWPYHRYGRGGVASDKRYRPGCKSIVQRLDGIGGGMREKNKPEVFSTIQSNLIIKKKRKKKKKAGRWDYRMANFSGGLASTGKIQ